MSKRPAYQWYPGDLRRDLAVQACSFEARALWREMLDLMHDGEPYGHLTAGGVPIDDAQLARIIGIKPAKITAWLFELESRKVFSRTPEGVIYSRRMVRDEGIREARAKGGPKSLGNPNVPRPKEPDKDAGKVSLPASLPASIRPSPAVAVAVASALQEQAAAENALKPPSAAKTLAKIKDLAETRDVPGQGTRQFIRKAAVQALGPKTFAAYQAIGGAEAVLNTPGEKWFILVKQFENELKSA